MTRPYRPSTSQQATFTGRTLHGWKSLGQTETLKEHCHRLDPLRSKPFKDWTPTHTWPLTDQTSHKLNTPKTESPIGHTPQRTDPPCWLDTPYSKPLTDWTPTDGTPHRLNLSQTGSPPDWAPHILPRPLKASLCSGLSALQVMTAPLQREPWVPPATPPVGPQPLPTHPTLNRSHRSSGTSVGACCEQR